jgi:phosphate transport system permease protein
MQWQVSRRTRVVGALGWSASIGGLCTSLAVLALIFFFVLSKGLPALTPTVLVTVTSGISGGLANAITGTLLLVAGGLVLALTIGVGTGMWLAEYGRGSWRTALRYFNDVLAGVPSIVIGYFGYVLFVQRFGWHFCLAAGSIALTLIMLPYVVRGTDQALSNVSRDLREASFALGATRAQTLVLVQLPVALPSLLTSVLLATGIGIGETAPLLYTAGWSNFMPSVALVHSPVAFLTYVVWTFISQPFAQAHALAYAAAAILMIMIFALNIISRLAITGFARIAGRAAKRDVPKHPQQEPRPEPAAA